MPRKWHPGPGKEEVLTDEQGAADDRAVQEFQALEREVAENRDPNRDATAATRELFAAAVAKLPEARAKHHLAEAARIGLRMKVEEPEPPPVVEETKKSGGKK